MSFSPSEKCIQEMVDDANTLLGITEDTDGYLFIVKDKGYTLCMKDSQREWGYRQISIPCAKRLELYCDLRFFKNMFLYHPTLNSRISYEHTQATR